MNEKQHLFGITQLAMALVWLPVHVNKEILSRLERDEMVDIVTEMARLSHYSYDDETKIRCIGHLFYYYFQKDLKQFAVIEEAVVKIEKAILDDPDRMITYIRELINRI